MAEGLAEAGGRLVLAARRIDKLDEVVRSMRTKGYDVRAMRCDVTDEGEVKRTAEAITGVYGSLDVLVNNAGTTFASPTKDLDVEEWRRVVDVNLTGVFLCTKHAAKQMIKQGRGKIVNVSSVYGVMVDTSLELPYYASKSGVIGLTRQLALEFASYNLQVNAIAPGFFPSEMTKPVIEDVDSLSYTLSRIPMKRIGKPEELKGIVRFLASKASDYVTGQLIVVDGGWSLW